MQALKAIAERLGSVLLCQHLHRPLNVLKTALLLILAVLRERPRTAWRLIRMGMQHCAPVSASNLTHARVRSGVKHCSWVFTKSKPTFKRADFLPKLLASWSFRIFYHHLNEFMLGVHQVQALEQHNAWSEGGKPDALRRKTTTFGPSAECVASERLRGRNKGEEGGGKPTIANAVESEARCDRSGEDENFREAPGR
jgi:hypothetical protein